MGIDLKRAITFFGEEQASLRKLALGGGLGLIPILGWAAALGIGVGVFRNVVKGSQELLPDFSEVGEAFFRGLAALAGLTCYAAAFGLAYLVVSLPLAFMVFGSGLGGHHLGGQIWLGLVGLVVYFAFNCAALMALALFAENLEVASFFSLLDLAGRVVSAGRDYLVVVAFWTIGSFILATLSGLVPGVFLSLCLVSFLGFPFFLSSVHALAQVAGSICHAELSDPLDLGTPISAASQPGVSARPRGRKASSLVDRPSDTVLTWSTDSDRPDSR